jgi:hypothetical protein
MCGTLLLCPLYIFMVLCLSMRATLPINFAAVCFDNALTALVHDIETNMFQNYKLNTQIQS